MKALVEHVKRYAAAHYRTWDVVVETWSDDNIAEVLTSRKATTEAEAVAAIQWHVNLYLEQEDNVMCQSGEHEKCPRCTRWYDVDKPCDCKEA